MLLIFKTAAKAPKTPAWCACRRTLSFSIAPFKINVAELKKQTADLQQRLSALETTVAKLPPDLSKVVRRGDTFKLGFVGVNVNKCLSYPDGEGGTVVGSDPAMAVTLLALAGDCTSSHELQFK
jgi:hypothetical protein